MRRVRLGVNVDHVATIRQARGTMYPEPVTAAAICELAGADQITIHLREDRRHIQDRDVELIRRCIQTRINLEMAATEEMKEIVFAVQPDMVTLVPEKREEQTTEGGLDVRVSRHALKEYIRQLKDAQVEVNLFIDPEADQVKASHQVGADSVELHTGDYCEAPTARAREQHLNRLRETARLAYKLGLGVAGGHGLDYTNVRAVAAIPEIEELNIGHSIVARAILVGLDRAVREMIDLMVSGRGQGK